MFFVFIYFDHLLPALLTVVCTYICLPVEIITLYKILLRGVGGKIFLFFTVDSTVRVLVQFQEF